MTLSSTGVDRPHPANLTGRADMADECPLIVIVGPTAAGKSAAALQLAARIHGEILSVDSMQVYRGMDIGTAKPNVDQRAQVKHHLIDIVDPNQDFTVARYVEQADRVITDARRRKTPLVAGGGTPLYFKALFEGLFEGPPADTSIRQKLGGVAAAELHERLSRIDPRAAARIHANDRKRLVRALEVFELTGRPISSFQTEWQRDACRHNAVWFGLLWEKDALNRRINARVRQMIESGWLDETRRLLRQYGSLSKTAAEATGYREIIEHLEGRMTLEDAIEQIKIATRQLARRQMKWFRRFRDVQWLNAELPAEVLVAQIASAVLRG